MNKFLDEFDEYLEEDLNIPEIDLTGVVLGKGGPEFNLLDMVVIPMTHNAYYLLDIKGQRLNGKKGYIIDYDGDNYLIYFIEKINGHNGCKKNNIPNNQGWWLNPWSIKKI